jgi:hypothetical protein
MQRGIWVCQAGEGKKRRELIKGEFGGHPELGLEWVSFNSEYNFFFVPV